MPGTCEITCRSHNIIAVILQARINSSRLHAKILHKIGNHAIVEHAMHTLKQLSRQTRCQYIGFDYFLATNTISAAHVENLAAGQGFRVFRGSDTDVLSRFAAIAQRGKYRYIVRATADNPFVSLYFAMRAVLAILTRHCDHLIYTGLPVGGGVEVISANALLSAHHEATSAYDREHVTPYIYNNPQRYKICTLPVQLQFNPDVNLSVDTWDDYLRVLRMYHDTLCTNKGWAKPIETLAARVT